MKHRTGLAHALVLIVIAALVYLPLISQIGFTHDDWYLMYAAGAEGADVFHEIYSVDRPLRAYVFEQAYNLFGQNVLPYNLSSWLFRVLSAATLLWLLRKIWRGQDSLNLLIAVLFLIYPGFLAQFNGVDYLPQFVSLAFAMLSLALTVHAFFEANLVRKVLAIFAAIVLGILYLGLVEYEVGFEALRVLLIFVLAAHAAIPFRERILKTIKIWLPYSLILLSFGVWRIFFFEGDRKATDVNVQFEQLGRYPLQTVFGWGVQVSQDLFDVFLSAWVIPLARLFDQVQGWGVLLTVIAAGLTIFASSKLNVEPQEGTSSVFSREALWLGFLSAAAALIPIAMVNREVAFPSFSRYALTSSVGVSIFAAALLANVNQAALRNALAAVFVLVSALTQHANAVQSARETAAMNAFWWQVSWRVPQFEKNTTLVANYLVGAAEEDYFVWGPASLIYYPAKYNPENIQPGVYAVVLNGESVTKILLRAGQDYDNRKNIITYKNYRNILILSQPSPVSCVHVINGLQPEFSSAESDSIRVIGAYSELERVLVDETPHAPPELIFGPEPARGWCYFYQSADLARQRGDWESVIRLGSEAQARGFAPSDLIEWMPFLQAYAVTDDVDRLMELASIISSEPYVALQVCRNIGRLPGISSAVAEIIDSQYCLE